MCQCSNASLEWLPSVKSRRNRNSIQMFLWQLSMRTRIRLFFAHHRTLALLRTLGFDGQAINFLLRKAISFCTVWSNHRWSVIRSSVTFSNKNKAASGRGSFQGRYHFRFNLGIISRAVQICSSSPIPLHY